jgi:hypothetical protein
MRFHNRLQKTVALTLILSTVLFILFSSVKKTGSDEYIWMEAENADYVIATLYIERDEEASGGKAVVCKGAHESNSGIAQYKISVKKEGKYYFWGKCYWKDACSNQFRIQYNNARYGFGNDPVFGRWHWVKGPSMDFKQGVNEVFLLSNDEEARMDAMLFTMDTEYVPFDKLQDVYFLDFEDSLINKLKIKNEENWRIVNDSISSICILVSSKENREIALLDKTNCSDDFIFQVMAKTIEPQSKLFIIIDYINDNNYRFISIDRKSVRYCHFNNGYSDLIFEKEGVFLNNVFKSIALAKTNEYLKLKIEGKTIFDLTTNTEMKGKTGIGVSEGNIFLDNIAYYFPVSLAQEDNFHDGVGCLFHKDRPEKAIKPFDNMKTGHNDWWALNGKWKRLIEKRDTEDIQGIKDTCNGSEKAAILIFGNDFWTDYTFNVAAKVKDDSGFGICTYFQDSLNYYLFRWFHDKDGYYKRQLIKMEDGNEQILASDNEMFVIDTWYDLGMKIYRDKLTAIVNNKPVLTATDHIFKEGRLGFWTNSSQNAHFDDIKISVSDSISETKNYRNYTFYTGNGGALARSLCDWTPDSQKNIFFYNLRGTHVCYLLKKVFDDVVLSNINALPKRFKMKVTTTKIPQDIDAVFEFASQTLSEEIIVYKFIISTDKITLLKNEKILVSDTIKCDREKIEIYRRNNEWAIEFDAKKNFEYKDKIETSTWNMAIGYSGIGKGQIFLNQIIVEKIP